MGVGVGNVEREMQTTVLGNALGTTSVETEATSRRPDQCTTHALLGAKRGEKSRGEERRLKDGFILVEEERIVGERIKLWVRLNCIQAFVSIKDCCNGCE